jgi:hypothetical protein
MKNESNMGFHFILVHLDYYMDLASSQWILIITKYEVRLILSLDSTIELKQSLHFKKNIL